MPDKVITQGKHTGKTRTLLQSIFNRIPVTIKIVVITVLIGLVLWAVMDHFHIKSIKKALEDRHKDTIKQMAAEQRMRFDTYVKKYFQALNFFAAQKRFNDYLQYNKDKKWSKDDKIQIKYYTLPPEWFPDRSTMRTFMPSISSSFVILLDGKQRAREVYRKGMDNPPGFLLKPDSFLYNLSQNQSFLTSIENVPYIVASKRIMGSEGDVQAVLAMACPIDDAFLFLSQGVIASQSLVALTTGFKSRIIASSNEEKLPVGAEIETLQESYLIEEEGFFDYGNSDLLINLTTFFPKTEIEAQIAGILDKERIQDAAAYIIFILAFAFIVYWIARHIQNITQKIEDFSSQTLGVQHRELGKGDQLLMLRERFLRLTEEVIKARGIIKQQAEELTNLIVNNASDAIITTDENGVVKTWNVRAENIFGWTREEAVGRIAADIIMPSQYIAARIKTGKPSFTDQADGIYDKNIETAAYHRDGHEVPVKLSVCSAWIEDNPALVTIMRDLTNQKVVEEKLRDSEGKLFSLFKNMQDVFYRTDLDGRLVLVSPSGAKLLGYESVDELIGRDLAGELYASPEQRLFFLDEISRKGRVTDYEIELRKKDGSTVIVSTNSHYYKDKNGEVAGVEGICRDITERKRVEEELMKFKFISDNSADAHFLINREGRFQYVNETACRMLGYTKNELLSLRVPDIDTTYDMNKYKELFDLARKGKVPLVETFNKKKDGTVFISEITITGYQIGGEPYIFSALRDISGRKKVEKRISFMAEALDASPISVIATDKNGNINYVNPATEELYGYKKEELFGKNPGILNETDDANRTQNEIIDAVVSKGVWKGELYNRHKSGKKFPVYASIYQLLDKKGEFISLVGFQEDITGRKQAEKILEIPALTLKEGKARLDSIFDAVGDAVSIQDTDFKVLYQNRRHMEIIDDQVGNYCYRAYQGRESVCERCHLAMSFDDGKVHRVEQSRQTDKGLAYYENTGSPLFDSSGKIIAGIEIVRNITDRVLAEKELQKTKDELEARVKDRTAELRSAVKLLKDEIITRIKAEKALRDSEERYRVLFEQAPDSLVLIDADTGELVEFNDRAYKNLGYTSEEFETLRMHDFEVFESEDAVKRHIEKIINMGALIYETKHRKKDGEIRNILVSSRTISVEERNFIQCIATDITEQKLTEKQIKDSLKEKEILLREVHHRVKNNLQIICSLYNFQKRFTRDSETYEMIKECQGRIQAMSLVHEKLYQSETLAKINFEKYIIDLTGSLFNFHEVNPNSIKLSVLAEDVSLDVNCAIPCGLIINELVTNALLYAFPGEDMQGEIKIIVNLLHDDEIEVIVSDNGIGLPEDLDMEEIDSLGFLIIIALIKQLNGRMDINRNNGTTFMFKFRRT